MTVRRLKLTDGLLYVEDDDDTFRVVTTEPKDTPLRKAYKRCTQRYNIGKRKLEWLPNGEYYYMSGVMYRRHTLTG